MNEICGDNRFEIIAKAKAHLLDATNIDTSEDEMKVVDSFLFRCWQMGWLDRYAEQTEPQKIGYCNECKWFRDKQVCGRCRSKNMYAPKDEPNSSEKPNNCEPQTKVETMSCAECKHRPIGAEICEEACHYEPQTDWHYDEQDATWYPYKHEDEPQQKSCATCKHALGNWDGESNNCGRCCGADRRFYEPKDEPQTKTCKGCKHSNTEKESDECYGCSRYYTDNYEPQTERSE